jgi:hypothetical protein
MSPPPIRPGGPVSPIAGNGKTFAWAGTESAGRKFGANEGNWWSQHPGGSSSTIGSCASSNDRSDPSGIRPVTLPLLDALFGKPKGAAAEVHEKIIEVIAQRLAKRVDQRGPVGRKRLEVRAAHEQAVRIRHPGHPKEDGLAAVVFHLLDFLGSGGH